MSLGLRFCRQEGVGGGGEGGGGCTQRIQKAWLLWGLVVERILDGHLSLPLHDWA